MKRFNHIEFFEYERDHGMTPDNEMYAEIHYSLGRKILSRINPKTVLEIGTGSGALLEFFCRRGVDAIGIDFNPFHKQYFESRNPEHFYRYVLHDLEEDLQDLHVDTIVSIECFEHLEDKVLDKAVDYVSRNCKTLIFSSTPHPDPEFDIQWGHVNVKPTQEWIKIFTSKGMKFIEQWDVPTAWTLRFENEQLNR